MIKHTLGPWEIKPEEEGADHIRIRGGRPGSRYRIANVAKPDFGDGRNHDEESRANARLIAKAPDLRRALEALVLFAIPTKSNAAALNFAHQVLADIEGETL